MTRRSIDSDKVDLLLDVYTAAVKYWVTTGHAAWCPEHGCECGHAELAAALHGAAPERMEDVSA